MTLPQGALSVVGCGIRAPAQATLESIGRIERATIVFSLVADPLAYEWIASLNPTVTSLTSLYAVGKSRWETYAEMVACILDRVRSGSHVCAVAYGHPGVFAYPLHEAVRQARAQGYSAEMLPGISADACLFAELGIDPSTAGCQSYEATDYLVHGRPNDPSTSLILWQIGLIGEPGYRAGRELWNANGLRVLCETLALTYPAHHVVTLFEAARFSAIPSRIQRVMLADLGAADVTPMSTLYVPPLTKPRIDPEMLRRLGIDRADPNWRRRQSAAQTRQPTAAGAHDVATAR